eukprot:352311-Chlamydomonas_euryale.AAC.1
MRCEAGVCCEELCFGGETAARGMRCEAGVCCGDGRFRLQTRRYCWARGYAQAWLVDLQRWKRARWVSSHLAASLPHHALRLPRTQAGSNPLVATSSSGLRSGSGSRGPLGATGTPRGHGDP